MQANVDWEAFEDFRADFQLDKQHHNQNLLLLSSADCQNNVFSDLIYVLQAAL